MRYLLLLTAASLFAAGPVVTISKENPRYWAVDGKTAPLIGGSVEDNLFQIPNLREHLDLLKASGGNYIRCTMSSRDPGDVWPFFPDPKTGKYNLNRMNPEYWRRFAELMRLTAERGIVVQIEVWDRFDFAREPWAGNPFNPKNNTVLTEANSKLKTEYEQHPGRRETPFFRSVPKLENNTLLLKYQRAFVDKLLEESLGYTHVLYCMDNETNEAAEWGEYWSTYIRERAAKRKREVHTTEMWDPWNLNDPMHLRTFDHPELYSFVDVSQNNHQKRQVHWDNLQSVRRRLTMQPRPMNVVKIYGASTGPYGTDRDGEERFWRGVIGGLATSRFHRPPAGLGLGGTAQAHLRSMRMLVDAIHFPGGEPRLDLLGNRTPNEAYLNAAPGKHYAVYFTDGGEVRLEMFNETGAWRLRWLDVMNSRWTGEAEVKAGTVVLAAPGPGHWTALLTPAR
jgi:hypothetical protein